MGERRGPSITAPEALEHFLAIGPGRTLPALAKALAQNPAIKRAPKLDCLKRWSTKYQWLSESERYDSGLLAKAREKVLLERIEKQFEWSKEFAKTGAEILERVRGLVGSIEIKTAQDLATLNQIAVICAREADAMEGAKPQPADETQAKASNVTQGSFPALPAPRSEAEDALQALEAMVPGPAPN